MIKIYKNSPYICLKEIRIKKNLYDGDGTLLYWTDYIILYNGQKFYLEQQSNGTYSLVKYNELFQLKISDGSLKKDIIKIIDFD